MVFVIGKNFAKPLLLFLAERLSPYNGVLFLSGIT